MVHRYSFIVTTLLRPSVLHEWHICWGIFTSPEKGLVSFRQLTSAGWLTAWPLSAHLTHPLLVSYPLIAIVTAVGSCIPQTSASQDNSAISRIVKAVTVGSYSKKWKCTHYVVLGRYIITAIYCQSTYSISLLRLYLGSNPTCNPLYWYIGNMKFIIINMQSFSIVPALVGCSYISNTLYNQLASACTKLLLIWVTCCNSYSESQ